MALYPIWTVPTRKDYMEKQIYMQNETYIRKAVTLDCEFNSGL